MMHASVCLLELVIVVSVDDQALLAPQSEATRPLSTAARDLLRRT